MLPEILRHPNRTPVLAGAPLSSRPDTPGKARAVFGVFSNPDFSGPICSMAKAEEGIENGDLSRKASPQADGRFEGRDSKQTPETNPKTNFAYCASCRSQNYFVPAKLNHGRHFLLTLLTLGLWAAVWFIFGLGAFLRPYRCEECGWHKPEFRGPAQ